MSENEKKQIRRKYTCLALGLLAVIAVFIVVSALIFKRVTIAYNIVIIAGLTAFWAIMDILVPVRAQDFEGKSPEQMEAYRKFAALDLLGYAGLMYFALAMRSNTSIYGALVYVVARMMRNRFKEEFDGTEEEESAQEAETPAADNAVREIETPTADDAVREIETSAADDAVQEIETLPGQAAKTPLDAAPDCHDEAQSAAKDLRIEGGAGRDNLS